MQDSRIKEKKENVIENKTENGVEVKKGQRDVITVLQVLSGLQVGGAESRVMDITRNLDNNKVCYAFLLNTKGPDFYEKEAKELGCSIYRIPRFCFYNYFTYKKAVKQFFDEHPEMDIVQGHMTSTAALYLPIAKKCGVKKTIAHARSAGVDKGIKGTLTKLLRKNLWKKTDFMWACSSEAAKAVYGEKNVSKVKIIPNAIDISKFEDSQGQRQAGDKIRKKYELENKLVIGHVGRFHYAKNHEFLLSVFAKILEKNPETRLLLVGEGSGMENVKARAKELGILQQVVFTGRQTNVADFYYAMDMLIFPSRYEGLPGTIVEAQASGLPCLISDTVTKDVAVTELALYESLQTSPEIWAEKAMGHLAVIKRRKTEADWVNPAKKLREAGFDVVSQVRALEHSYEEMLK